jgi:phage FluMu protein Com
MAFVKCPECGKELYIRVEMTTIPHRKGRTKEVPFITTKWVTDTENEKGVSD